MEKERMRASQQGYPDPVNDTYEDTCQLYDKYETSYIEMPTMLIKEFLYFRRVVKHVIENYVAGKNASLKKTTSEMKFSPGHYLVVASHNQESLFNAIQVMKDNGLEKNCENVVFGQIYGMGEQISMPLGKK